MILKSLHQDFAAISLFHPRTGFVQLHYQKEPGIGNQQ